MSRVYWHSEHGQAELMGRERAYGSSICSNALIFSLGLDSFFAREKEQHPVTQFVPEHYLKTMYGHKQYEALATWFRVGYDGLSIPGVDAKPTPFSLSLNTAWTMGNDAVRLLARIHGQCEIHLYVEGKNRAWLADIIQRGLDTHLYHSDVHWDKVIELLRSRDDEPVVTSYSVTEQFPNAHAANWKPTTLDKYDDPDWDAWYKLPEQERWSLALAELRSEDRGLELKPDDWEAFHFYPNINGFELMELAAKTAV